MKFKSTFVTLFFMVSSAAFAQNVNTDSTSLNAPGIMSSPSFSSGSGGGGTVSPPSAVPSFSGDLLINSISGTDISTDVVGIGGIPISAIPPLNGSDLTLISDGSGGLVWASSAGCPSGSVNNGPGNYDLKYGMVYLVPNTTSYGGGTGYEMLVCYDGQIVSTQTIFD